MFQFCRFQKVAVVAGLVLSSAAAQAERLAISQPPANESATKPKPWKTRFEELSLASGKCKAAIGQVSELFTAYEVFSSKPEAEQTQKDSDELNKKFGAVLSTYLMDPEQACSKRVFIGFMVAAISTDIEPAKVERSTQEIVGGIIYGKIKLMSADQERQLVLSALKSGLPESSSFIIEDEKLPTLATYFNPEHEATLYLNPRITPSVLVKALGSAVQEQIEYFKNMDDYLQGRAQKIRRLASFGPLEKPAPSSSNQRL